ncbi:hypothetical protein MDA_GLEAN10018974 [Myotis davidii]|uniref:Uncharacterized protein n=1 Tax=Myotis davidii TaxID=225400 RepID=L5M2K2_MYODS|nr:hypothetical protein MDA_GLEAN10018974 [Myotis davidii]
MTLHPWQRLEEAPSTRHFLYLRSGSSAPAAGDDGFTRPPSQRREAGEPPSCFWNTKPIVQRRSFNLGHI